MVVDDDGDITGIQGSIIERHLNLSKALDELTMERPSKTFSKIIIAQYVWAVKSPVDDYDGVQLTGPIALVSPLHSLLSQQPDGLWGLNAQGVQFSSVGNITYELAGGLDYQLGGGMTGGWVTSSLVMVILITKMRLKSIT